MKAHLFSVPGRVPGSYRFSGYNAQGDPFDGAGFRASTEKAPRPFDAVVDVGRPFIITEGGLLYITGPGPHQFTDWTPSRLVAAARVGWFGMRLVTEGRP